MAVFGDVSRKLTFPAGRFRQTTSTRTAESETNEARVTLPSWLRARPIKERVSPIPQHSHLERPCPVAVEDVGVL